MSQAPRHTQANLRGKTIAVTGASGMIGVYICRSLLRAGVRVIGVVRDPDKASFLVKEGVEFRPADLADTEALTRAFAACDAVVSNAAMYRADKHVSTWQHYERANVTGTCNVFEAAHRAEVTRIVHISTCGVYRWALVRTLDEQSPQIEGHRQQGSPYRATKQISERLAWEYAERLNLHLTTLRPAGVFGARDRNRMSRIRRWLQLPILPMPSILFPFAYAGDVADAVVGALASDASIGHAYNVGGHLLQYADFVKAVADLSGSSTRIVALPMPIGLRLDDSRAQRDIGFHCRPLREALSEVLNEDAAGLPAD